MILTPLLHHVLLQSESGITSRKKTKAKYFAKAKRTIYTARKKHQIILREKLVKATKGSTSVTVGDDFDGAAKKGEAKGSCVTSSI